MSDALIGIIGASGWLGRALAEALVAAGIFDEKRLVLSYRSQAPSFLPDAAWTRNNQDLVDRCDVILLSVRPHDFSSLEVRSGGKLVISVMAGVTALAISRRFATDRVVRCLPNAAAEVGRSYTPWFGSSGVTDKDRELVARILGACGTADEVHSEADIDYFTGLTGSGPAFPALLAEAMMNDAIRRGISGDIAVRSVTTLLAGTGALLDRRRERPDEVVRTFLDYRGTTAAAIEAMRNAGFEEAVRCGLSAALLKSEEMGRLAAEDS